MRLLFLILLIPAFSFAQKGGIMKYNAITSVGPNGHGKTSLRDSGIILIANDTLTITNGDEEFKYPVVWDGDFYTLLDGEWQCMFSTLNSIPVFVMTTDIGSNTYFLKPKNE